MFLIVVVVVVVAVRLHIASNVPSNYLNVHCLLLITATVIILIVVNTAVDDVDDF